MLTVIILCAALGVSLPAHSQDQFAITLDGRVDSDEWKNADVYMLQTDGEVKVMKDEQYVYVAFRGKELGWTHVYTLHRDTIDVLHASAALGASRYIEGKDGNWISIQSFDWELRDTTMSQSAVKGRREYLKKHGWVGTVVFMHPDRQEQEYVISRTLFDSGRMRVAFVRASRPEAPHYWPGTLADATRAVELVRGVTVDTLKFVPSEWATIQ